MTSVRKKSSSESFRTPRWLRGPPKSLRSIINREEDSIYRRMRKAIVQELRIKSVSKLHQGLQSFRSMRRMEASFKKARPLQLRFSQSLARRRQRLSQAIVRSTIQRLGSCTNPDARSDRLMISVLR